MAGGVGTEGSVGKGKISQDFELNITALIDCFTVLIAFMLVAAAFVSIGILDAGVAAAGATSSASTKSQLLTIELRKDHSFEVKLTGQTKSTNTVNPSQNTWNFEELSKVIGDLKSRWPDLTAATLIADNSTEYQDVVKSLEITRKVIPAVLLGGF